MSTRFTKSYRTLFKDFIQTGNFKLQRKKEKNAGFKLPFGYTSKLKIPPLLCLVVVAFVVVVLFYFVSGVFLLSLWMMLSLLLLLLLLFVFVIVVCVFVVVVSVFILVVVSVFVVVFLLYPWGKTNHGSIAKGYQDTIMHCIASMTKDFSSIFQIYEISQVSLYFWPHLPNICWFVTYHCKKIYIVFSGLWVSEKKF